MSTTQPNLRFEYEWERGAGVEAPELAATWARLEVWVGDQCVTNLEDADSGSARRSVYCPLYPLAEWIAFNWWLLQANVRPATVAPAIPWRKGAPWMQHHSLRAAGDGFLWPDLLVLPEGRSTRLMWHADRQPMASDPIRFIGSGEALLDSGATQLALAEVVESVLGRLDERGIGESPLGEEWDAISSADEEEREFCLAAARLGLDPYSLEESTKASIVASAERLEGRMLDDFLEAVTPTRIGDGLAWIERSSRVIDRLEAEPSGLLGDVRAAVSDHKDKLYAAPWNQGWKQADAVREFFELSPDTPFDTNGMIERRRQDVGDRSLQGLGGLTPSRAGALVVGRRLKEPDFRFASARALWHFAFEETPERFLLTPSHADRQRVERAFAAELLAPAEGVKELLADESGVVTVADVEDVADHFRVSPFVVRHQVENQLALRVA